MVTTPIRFGPAPKVRPTPPGSIAASQVLFDQTADAIESIESATRSAVRTTESVGDILTQTAELASGDIADRAAF